MNIPLTIVATCIIAYLFGSLSSAIVVCRLMGLPDPRTQGSKNPGATNVLRIGGKKAAALTLAGDMLKGLIPVLACHYFDFSSFELSLIALSAFLGHLFPLFFRFEGGKGVATALGTSIALDWRLGAAMIATWLVVAFAFRYSSLAALTMMALAPLYAWYFFGISSAGIIAIMSALLIARHHANIQKLLAGTESKIGKKNQQPASLS
ncbi:MAG TPA: glycerol-3-phosphate 1-O-acyltransferase PlsY [Gammaproteobacteria bacterium]|nr:glycerol-3-phosphate 1-O-acyltransferase PlsY [Gammaproteobacteria bacterium]